LFDAEVTAVKRLPALELTLHVLVVKTLVDSCDVTVVVEFEFKKGMGSVLIGATTLGDKNAGNRPLIGSALVTVLLTTSIWGWLKYCAIFLRVISTLDPIEGEPIKSLLDTTEDTLFGVKMFVLLKFTVNSLLFMFIEEFTADDVTALLTTFSLDFTTTNCCRLSSKLLARVRVITF
jgi:hypothetical protein